MAHISKLCRLFSLFWSGNDSVRDEIKRTDSHWNINQASGSWEANRTEGNRHTSVAQSLWWDVSPFSQAPRVFVFSRNVLARSFTQTSAILISHREPSDGDRNRQVPMKIEKCLITLHSCLHYSIWAIYCTCCCQIIHIFYLIKHRVTELFIIIHYLLFIYHNSKYDNIVSVYCATMAGCFCWGDCVPVVKLCLALRLKYWIGQPIVG